MSVFPGLHLPHLYSQYDFAFHRNIRDLCLYTNTRAIKIINEELWWIWRRGCSVVGRNTNSEKSMFWLFARYLKACERDWFCKCLFNLGVRFKVFGGQLSMLSLSPSPLPPRVLFVDVMFGSVMWNKMPHQMSDYWVTRMPSGCYYANSLRRYSPEISVYKVKANLVWVIAFAGVAGRLYPEASVWE